MTSRTFKSCRGAVSNKRAQSRRRTPNRRYHRARRRIGGFTLNKKIQRVQNTVKVGKDAAEWRGRRRVKQVKKRMYCRRMRSHKSSIRSKHTHKKVHRLRSKYGGCDMDALMNEYFLEHGEQRHAYEQASATDKQQYHQMILNWKEQQEAEAQSAMPSQ